jgi:peptidoglycan hydrolase CwlO-like protein
MLETILWVFLGIIIGLITGIVIISMTTSGKIADLENEIQDLRTQRKLLKEEIFRLDNQAKPKPRKKRNYKSKNKKR